MRCTTQKILKKRQSNDGFTIVELLIVIVVIGILAAITIVAYAGVQGKANDVVIQADLQQLTKQIELYNVLTGAYPTTTGQLANAGLKVAKSAYSVTYPNGSTMYNLLYCWPTAGNSGQYSLVAFSKSGKGFQATGSAVSNYSGPNFGSVAICNASGVSSSTTTVYWLYAGSWANFLNN